MIAGPSLRARQRLPDGREANLAAAWRGAPGAIRLPLQRVELLADERVRELHDLVPKPTEHVLLLDPDIRCETGRFAVARAGGHEFERRVRRDDETLARAAELRVAQAPLVGSFAGHRPEWRTAQGQHAAPGLPQSPCARSQRAVAGSELAPEALEEAAVSAAAACSPITDARGTAEYRRQVVAALVPRALRISWLRATGEWPAGTLAPPNGVLSEAEA